MRIIFTYIFSLLLIQFSKAQPAFNSVTVPAFGTTISVETKSDNTVDPGLAGNQTWNFSAVTFSNAAQSYSIQNPSGSSYPSATIKETAPGGNFAYYNATSTQQVLVGASGTIQGYSATLTYTNPVNVILYPINYQTQQTDNFASSFSVSGGGFTFPGSSSGTISTEYDGYGTLITNNNTYTDVVRIKTVRDETYVVSSLGISVVVNTVSYSWVEPGSYFPLFNIQDVTTTQNGGTPSTTRTISLYGSPVSANKNSYTPDLKISVGPNPTAEKISIDFKDVEAGSYELSLWNDKGVVVSQKNIYATPGDVHELNMQSLTSGVYIVKISSVKGEYVKKIIKN